MRRGVVWYMDVNISENPSASFFRVKQALRLQLCILLYTRDIILVYIKEFYESTKLRCVIYQKINI
jgi:hypothetical protein